MPFDHDLKQLWYIANDVDPSFAHVQRSALAAQFERTKQAAHSGAEPFILHSMRLMALAGNGHSRVFPHAAVHTLPLRMIAFGDDIVLSNGSQITAINGHDIDDICTRARPFLAGTPARQRSITPMLLAWPAALRALDVDVGDQVEFTMQDGKQITLQTADCVPTTQNYPIAETGHLHLSTQPPSDTITYGTALHIRLHDLKAMTPRDSQTALSHALSNPRTNLIIDLRGNPGGSFFNTMPLIDGLKQHWLGDHCAVLVDKFTFSAAIVCVALLVHRLGDRVQVMGEPMGDDLTFWAEGDTHRMTDSGADLRFSTEPHDWETGKVDPTQSPEIADVQVGIGPLRITPLPFSAKDMARGHDVTLKAAYHSFNP